MAVVSVYLFPPLSSGGAQVPRLTLFPDPPHRTGRAVFRSRLSDELSHHGMHQRPRRQPARDAVHLLESPEQPGVARVSLISGSWTRRGAPLELGLLPSSAVVFSAECHRYDEPLRLPRRLLPADGARRTPRPRGISLVGSVLKASTSQLPFIVSVAIGVSRQLPRQNLSL